MTRGSRGDGASDNCDNRAPGKASISRDNVEVSWCVPLFDVEDCCCFDGNEWEHMPEKIGWVKRYDVRICENEN